MMLSAARVVGGSRTAPTSASGRAGPACRPAAMPIPPHPLPPRNLALAFLWWVL